MSTASCFLSDGVHWCIVDQQCIILDIKHDRYLQLPGHVFTSLLPFVSEAKYQDDADFGGDVPSNLADTARELLEVGVLTHTPSRRRPMPRRDTSRATQLISCDSSAISSGLALRLLPQFLTACALADYLLRRKPFCHIVSRASARKSASRSSSSGNINERAITLAQVFQRLRPLYPRDYLCLFDSLALLEFFAQWRIHPDWVFGVTVDPFMAHCWVQLDTVVLADSITFGSRWFTPILTL